MTNCGGAVGEGPGGLDAETRGRHFVDVPTHTVLTEPTRPLAAPLVAYLDRRVWLSQRGRNGILATATGSEAVEARIGSTLGPQSGLRRAAAARHTRLETHDGAPLVGFARGSKTIVLAGFGDAAIFFTPAIARHLAGAPSAAEADYFAARDVGRGNARQLVADFVPEPV